MEISPEGDIYIAYRNNVENIRDIYIAIKAAGSDGFNDIIRASVHNDYNNHCPSSGPSMQIENNMIAISYRVSDVATSYIDYSDISILSFDNAVLISSSESSPNFSDDQVLVEIKESCYNLKTRLLYLKKINKSLNSFLENSNQLNWEELQKINKELLDDKI